MCVCVRDRDRLSYLFYLELFVCVCVCVLVSLPAVPVRLEPFLCVGVLRVRFISFVPLPAAFMCKLCEGCVCSSCVLVVSLPAVSLFGLYVVCCTHTGKYRDRICELCN